jgi:hypothetical protein
MGLFGRRWILLPLLLGGLGCAETPAPVLRQATTTRGLKICWRADDEGDDAVGRALRAALTQRLGQAGYVLVPSSCDFHLAYTSTTQWRHPPGWFAQVRVVLRSRSGSFLDKLVLNFNPYDVSADDFDQIAILVVNGLNDSPKLAGVTSVRSVVQPVPPVSPE